MINNVQDYIVSTKLAMILSKVAISE